jgi:hypothetical protein
LTAYAQACDALAPQPPVDEVRQLVVVALAELEQARVSGKMMLAVRACCRVRSSGPMCLAAPAAPRDVKRLVEADEPPRYERAAVGSMLDRSSR